MKEWRKRAFTTDREPPKARSLENTMLAEQGRRPNRYSETRVYLDNKKEGDFSGYLAHPATGLAWRFDDTVALVALHETVFGQTDYPQSGYRLRVMTEEKGQGMNTKETQNMPMDTGDIVLGEKPTFIINVQYRQHTTWQGTIQWVEGGVEKRFRSALELIKLMDSVVSGDSSVWQ